MPHYTEMPENWKMVESNPDILYFHILSQEKISTIQKLIQSIFKCVQAIKQQNLFIGKPTSHNDHYIINMGRQRPKIGGN